MKRKSFVTLVSGVFAVTALAVTGALVLGNSNISNLFFAKANGPASASYSFTADDFKSASGSITKNGATWNYSGASGSGGVVTLTGNLYTTVRSGSTKADERRGNGYTGVSFAGLDKEEAVGLVLYTQDVGGAVKENYQVENTIDLTRNGAVESAKRRGLEFAQGAGSHFSFTSITFNYDCTDVAPEIDITETEAQIGVGEDLQLHTERQDVYEGDTVSVSWLSEDEDIFTVSDSGLITGVAAGKADVTVTMTVNGKDYTDSLEVTVTAAQATVEEMKVLEDSRIQGAGIFCKFNPSTASVTAAQLNGFVRNTTLEFADPDTNNKINFVNYQDTFDNSYTAYVVCDSAVGLNNAFTIVSDYKDNTNNIIYRATFHFDNGALAPEIVLTASGFSVDEGDYLEITATKASYLEGTPAFTFESLDEDVFTVSSVGNVATVTGVAEGSADLRVTMTIGEDVYVVTKTIAVTAAGV